jgi:hypothetical protein
MRRGEHTVDWGQHLVASRSVLWSENLGALAAGTDGIPGTDHWAMVAAGGRLKRCDALEVVAFRSERD